MPGNHNLEQQAQALYKSWFVDFEPFKAGKFVDSELGLIPEGWEVIPASEICSINIGKTPPRQERQWFSNSRDDYKWVSISDMGNCGIFISDSAEKLTKEAIDRFNIIIVPQNTVLLSFKLTIGRVAISNCDMTTNEAIARFLTDSVTTNYLYLTLKNYDFSKLGSTSSIATAVNSKIIKAMPILLPSQNALYDFAKQVEEIFETIRRKQEENKVLSAIRDSILPKLMSGELKISDLN